ncbi:DUF4231 domain-containing protein [Streptomyces stramineus]
MVFQAADTASLAGQRSYMTGTKWRLLLAVLAAALAAVDMTTAVAAVLLAFLATVCLEVWMLAERPERAWYDGRALAESTKTLAWRYAVGGEPFSADLPGPSRPDGSTSVWKYCCAKRRAAASPPSARWPPPTP